MLLALAEVEVALSLSGRAAEAEETARTAASILPGHGLAHVARRTARVGEARGCLITGLRAAGFPE